MLNIEQLKQLSESPELWSLSRRLEGRSLGDQYDQLYKLSKDEIAALHLIKGYVDENHFHNTFSNELQKPSQILNYLATIEVPHFNIYHMGNKFGERILDLLIICEK